MPDGAISAKPLVVVEAAMIGLPGSGAAIGPFTLDLPRAKISSLVGPSGSGKTTLVRAIVERRPPLSGRILIAAEAAEVAYVPQNVSDRLNGMASALRHMRDISAQLGRKAAAELLARFRIPGEAMHRPVATFSIGQQQRLVLLAAVLRRPQLVVLDEPTSALDVEMRQELGLILRDMVETGGVTILLTSHHLPFVSLISDRIWRLMRTDADLAA